MAEENKTEFPEAKNPLTREEADKMAVLIRLDIARYETEAARAQITLDQARYYVAQSKVALADLERRVANVDYPRAPEEKPENAPEDEGSGTVADQPVTAVDQPAKVD